MTTILLSEFVSGLKMKLLQIVMQIYTAHKKDGMILAEDFIMNLSPFF